MTAPAVHCPRCGTTNVSLLDDVLYWTGRREYHCNAGCEVPEGSHQYTSRGYQCCDGAPLTFDPADCECGCITECDCIEEGFGPLPADDQCDDGQPADYCDEVPR